MKDNRTEKPTPKRKREARKKGQVARSMELSNALALAAITVLVPIVVPRLGRALVTNFEQVTGRAGTLTPEAATAALGSFFGDAMIALVPLVAVIAVTGTLGGLVMAGPRPNVGLLKPKFERINPKNGLKKIFSKQVVWEFLRTSAKLAGVALVGVGTWKAGLGKLIGNPGSMEAMISIVGSSIRELLWRVALLGLIVGIADAVVNKRRHLKGLKMTKQELKDEHRQTEGDPLVKGAIRQRQQKISRLRMIAAVADADVVVTNPTHFAVALAYEDGSPAPTVVAKGADKTALRIREEAAKHGVPTMENKPLARSLFRTVDVGDFVPPALFRAVAEVLAVVYRTRKRRAA